jgi:hypothetical protein
MSALLATLLMMADSPEPALSPTMGLFSAGRLREKCQSTVASDASYCFAYIVGVHDATRAYENWLNLREFCTPDGVVQGELRRAFMDYLADNAGYSSGEAASVVIVALKKRYPCAPDKRRK